MGPGIQEATPLVHNGMMYLPNPSDYIQALDAATGALKWEYKRKLPEDLGKFMNFTMINRNLAIYGNTIIDTSGDDFVYALNAESGELAWENRIMDYRETPAQHTAGPIIAQGKILSTRGCEPRNSADACAVTAHDAKTGRELWRFHLIPRPGEPGDETWGGVPYEKRHHVGAWMAPSFDPELNLMIFGTTVTAPAPKYMLGGPENKHLYHDSTIALNADTGKLVWYYQHMIDNWDLDHPFERLLVDTAVAPDASEVPWINPKIQPGEVRKVVTGIPGKTGIVYTLDRATGEFLWARPTTPQNVVTSIDGATGAVTMNRDLIFTALGQEYLICPNVNSGKGYQAGSYSPVTKTMFYGLINACADTTSVTNEGPGAPFYAISYKTKLAPGMENGGSLFAISAETGKTIWRHDQRAGMMSSVATGGGLVFTGDAVGMFRAFDQETGKILWEVNLGSPLSGYPITYAVNGRQYVAVSTGGSLVTAAINRLTPELKPSAANNIFVFALPE